ncbi:Apl5p KNAG_0D05120 [Huiozyma naganishii CBS 8797]|uniref:AP-3 complex subunit delta n=1 Tax=Huiozyma naganishii (strain ATCC MYA-139 / BCRC 22969 / CBS 8797 / KCTC 17520 / NBRC 10181 / NCYC 3082 / Yp74L-3) TaxID=1071383 RepID=J7S7C8_HUIN7|nr:hypothetical protein KNAG_0D05120 [Kazachstania naganishii CBS 8797]CCK70251.1 hypothetical protein KNAG_0D05120 [Kazachstania naganishii CBS 8797]
MLGVVQPVEDVKQRLRPFGLFFERSLKDLIKGIRAHGDSPESLEKYLAEELSHCREEVNSLDMNLKSNAVLKLAYLEMYGFDMSWANFHILEVMSSTGMRNKRVGYLAASQSFNRDPDILILMTNLLQKDLKYSATGGNDTYKIGVALSGVSSFVTKDLAKDIVQDLLLMLNNSKPYIRKKTVVALFKVYLQYPESLRDTFDQFVLKLEDEDRSVVSATVSVICELSKQNPSIFIQLSPVLYEILVTIDNNWIIIRLLKLFTNLSKVEPKLKHKLLPKIVELMDSTSATSVLYESINCIVKGQMLSTDDFDVAMKCLKCLNEFCISQDPNLRYISCLLFYKIGKINPQFVEQFDELILHLLCDVDVSIRSKALELLNGITHDGNLKLIVSTLMKQFVNEEVVVIENYRNAATRDVPIVVPEDYKIKLVTTIIKLCSMNNFINIPDFKWYNTVLIDLVVVSSDLKDKTRLGSMIGEQIKSVMLRVPDLRNVTMTTIITILTMEKMNLSTVLKECVWCLGEYSKLIENGDALIQLLIRNAPHFNAETKVVLIPAILKLFGSWCNGPANQDLPSIKIVLNDMIDFLDTLTTSSSFEIQERSIEVSEILKLSLDAVEMQEQDNSDEGGLPLLLCEVIPGFFNSYELLPILAGTQRRLQEEGQISSVDLITPFLTQTELSNILKDYDEIQEDGLSHTDRLSDHDGKYRSESDLDDSVANDAGNAAAGDEVHDDLHFLEEQRRQEQLSNPFYLTEESEGTKATTNDLLSLDSNDSSKREDLTLIKLASENLTANAGKTGERKKRGKAKRAVVLADEVVIEPNPRADSTTLHQKVAALNKSDRGINLVTQSQLSSFDFSKKGDDRELDDAENEAELEKLRKKFAAQSLDTSNVSEPVEDQEEVIVIKKKKKSKKKKKKNEEDVPDESNTVQNE